MLSRRDVYVRWMCDKTRKDKIRNERIRGFLGIAPIEDKIKERRLTWYGHVMRRPPTAPIRRCLDMQVSVGRRQRGRPSKTWIKAVKEDILDLEIRDGLWEDRVAWRARIHVADPDYVGNVL